MYFCHLCIFTLFSTLVLTVMFTFFIALLVRTGTSPTNATAAAVDSVGSEYWIGLVLRTTSDETSAEFASRLAERLRRLHRSDRRRPVGVHMQRIHRPAGSADVHVAYAVNQPLQTASFSLCHVAWPTCGIKFYVRSFLIAFHRFVINFVCDFTGFTGWDRFL